MENSKENQKPILVKIANQLLKDQQELDSLAVQLSLGKADAKDKLKEVKAEIREKLQELRGVVSSGYKESKEWAEDTNTAIDELEEALEESVEEIFEESKSKIIHAAEKLKEQIKSNPASEKLALLYATFYEKAHLQLELLEHSAHVKKEELTENYKHNIEKARKSANAIIEKLNDKKEEAEVRIEIFKEELDEVYKHLKKAVKAFSQK
ncbi:Uncharacterised protein [Sphingobacterium multivorum]|uniref:hypothetical protein n=1 Tax=Sphingobacterium multivorum TaxID=28454 RepID=UPI000DFED320|nr:hypothetical protein [Sphingobacterium multivorum]QQT46643.1 hypothetical protein I6J00_08300 [Sphingobacterium multivorum]SUJ89304.1 Uncharacterised protein [Sphingobacterium multivorum]